MNLLSIAEIAAATVSVVTLVGAAVAGIVAYAKAKGSEAAIGILTTANAGLRDVNTDLQARQEALSRDFTEKLHTQELDCAKQIADLQGKLSLLTNGLAHDIVAAVVLAMDAHAAKGT